VLENPVDDRGRPDRGDDLQLAAALQTGLDIDGKGAF